MIKKFALVASKANFLITFNILYPMSLLCKLNFIFVYIVYIFLVYRLNIHTFLIKTPQKGTYDPFPG